MKRTNETKSGEMFMRSIYELRLLLDYLSSMCEETPKKTIGEKNDPAINEVNHKIFNSKFEVLIRSLEAGIQNLRREFEFDFDDELITDIKRGEDVEVVTLLDLGNSSRTQTLERCR